MSDELFHKSLFLVPVTLALLLLFAAGCVQPKKDPKTTDLGELILANAPQLQYTGRIDFADPKKPILVWEGSSIKIRFNGTKVIAALKSTNGRNYFNVIIDGNITVTNLILPMDDTYVLVSDLPEGVHTLELFKRTEAYSNEVAFGGFYLNKKGVLLDPPVRQTRKIEFYGDSITAGACNEDLGDDQYGTLATHNNYLAYGAITARNFDAEYSCIAVSGIGLTASWNPLLMPEVYNRIHPEKTASALHDYTAWQADAVVFMLGQNDFGFPQSKGEKISDLFAGKYVEFVKTIRGHYPNAEFFCVLGGIDVAPDLLREFNKAIAILKQQDPKVHDYVIGNDINESRHPQVTTHEKMAEKITAFIKQTMWK